MAKQGMRRWAVLGGMTLALAIPGMGWADDQAAVPDYHSKTSVKTTEQTEESTHKTKAKAKDDLGTGGSGLVDDDMALPKQSDVNGTGGAGNVDNDTSTKTDDQSTPPRP